MKTGFLISLILYITKCYTLFGDIMLEFNLVDNFFFVYSMLFIYLILNLKVYPLTAKKKFLLCLIMIAIFMLDCYIYYAFSWPTEYGEIKHVPNFIENTIMLIVFLVLYKRDRLKALYYIVLGFVVVQFSLLVYRVIFVNSEYQEWYSLSHFIILAVSYICIRIGRKSNRIYESKDWISFSVLAGVFYLYLFYITEEFPKLDFTDMNVIIAFEFIQIAFMLSVFGIFYFYLSVLGDRNKDLNIIELQLDNQKQQKQLLEELKKANQENRKLRHDLKHHFHSLEYMMDTDPEKAKSYLHELSEHVEAVKVLTTKNQVLDYIVNSKMAICRTKGIAFTYEVQDNLKQMQDFDLISLLSNALDNAIEAQEYVHDKFISCSICDGKTTTIIHIENACNTSKLQKDKHTFQTIKKDKGQHGIGLGRIQAIAESYHGHMKIQITDNFILEISIPKNRIEDIN